MSQSTVTQLRPNIDNWEARCDLAAAFRVSARLGLNHSIGNHFSLMLPGSDELAWLDRPR